MADNGDLNAAQLRAVPVLAAGGTHAAAAKAADRAPRTIHRWTKDDAFAAAVDDARAVLFRSALDALAGGATEAARYLVSVVTDDAEATPVRVNAARLVLTLGQSQREAVELDERIEALEQAGL